MGRAYSRRRRQSRCRNWTAWRHQSGSPVEAAGAEGAKGGGAAGDSGKHALPLDQQGFAEEELVPEVLERFRTEPSAGFVRATEASRRWGIARQARRQGCRHSLPCWTDAKVGRRPRLSCERTVRTDLARGRTGRFDSLGSAGGNLSESMSSGQRPGLGGPTASRCGEGFAGQRAGVRQRNGAAGCQRSRRPGRETGEMSGAAVP